MHITIFQLILSLGDGGEGKYNTNINFLLEDYGIMINSDSVVRTSYYKYFHPKVRGVDLGPGEGSQGPEEGVLGHRRETKDWVGFGEGNRDRFDL